MKEYRITMAAEMVAAVYDDKKTVSRRLKDLHPVNDKPDAWEFVRFWDGHAKFWQKHDATHEVHIKSPYGSPGDVLWMTEPHVSELVRPGARPDSPVFGKVRPVYWYDKSDLLRKSLKWKDSHTLRREWARQFLEVIDIRLERLFDATNVSAIDEGMLSLSDQWVWNNFIEYSNALESWHIRGKKGAPPIGPAPRDKLFKYLRGCYNPESIDTNPWVWVIKFERLKNYTNDKSANI